MSHKHWKSHTFGESSGQAQPLSGPYRIKDFKFGSYLALERVEDFWAKDHPVYRGMFNFDQVTFEFYRDKTVAFEALKSGRLDFWIEYIAKNWATAYDFPAIREGKIIKKAIPHQRPSGTQAFFMNMRRPLFKDIRVRKALSLLFDYHWINKNIFASAYKRTNSHFPNSEMGATGLPSEKELSLLIPFKQQLPEDVFTTAFQLPEYNDPKMVRSALREAMGLLRAAGWKYQNEQLVHQTTQQVFEFELLTDGASFQRILLPFAKNLKKVGITANIRIVDSAQFKVRLDDFDFDITTVVLPQSASPGEEQQLYYHSNQVSVRGSKNLSGIADPVVDALLDTLTSAKTLNDLKAHTKALDRVILWNYYTIPQWHLNYYRIAYESHLQQPTTLPKYNLGFQAWWLESEPPINHEHPKR